MKKRQIFYVDDKFIRKFGMENKSQIVNDALAKYFFAEKQNYKNDLQIIKDFTETVAKLNEQMERLQMENNLLQKKLNLTFNMSLMSAYSTDVILEQKFENDKRAIIGNVEKLKADYKELQILENSLKTLNTADKKEQNLKTKNKEEEDV